MIPAQGKAYVGIDPGQSGGIGVIWDDIEAFPMPGSEQDIVKLIANIRQKAPEIVVILEKAQAMPKQGIVSTGKYMESYGFIKGALAAMKIPFQEVRPAVWKREILSGEIDKRDKNTSIRICGRIFPQVGLILPRCRKPHDGMAEALLIAEYGRRKNL